MGNNCCATEDTKELFTEFNAKKQREMVNNITRSTKESDKSHFPQTSIALPCMAMNPMHPLVSKTYNLHSDITQIDKNLLQRTKDYPILGPFKYNDGSTYEGQYFNGKRYGIGKQIWSDGSVYEGQWINDHCNGQGKLINSEGHVYYGEWENDKAHGFGVFKNIDGTVYRGEWKNDL